MFLLRYLHSDLETIINILHTKVYRNYISLNNDDHTIYQYINLLKFTSIIKNT